MSGIPESERNLKAICVRVSDESYQALKAIAKAKSGTVTAKAQELVEAAKNVKPANWHQALSAFEVRGKGE